jgi:hypothetical protein
MRGGLESQLPKIQKKKKHDWMAIHLGNQRPTTVYGNQKLNIGSHFSQPLFSNSDPTQPKISVGTDSGIFVLGPHTRFLNLEVSSCLEQSNRDPL